MTVGHPRVLLISLLCGIALAVVVATVWSLLGSTDFIYATGAVMFIVGLIALVVGLLGAAEPEEGWATGKGSNRRQEGRRSFVARVSGEHPRLEGGSSWALAVWGVVVGGGLIALSMGAFAMAA